MSSAVLSSKMATGITEHTGELINVASTLLPPSRAAGPTSNTKSGAVAITVSATVSAVVVSTYTRCRASDARSAGSKMLSAPTSKIVGSIAAGVGAGRRAASMGPEVGRTGFFGGVGRAAKAAAGRADERSFILSYHPPPVSGGPARSFIGHRSWGAVLPPRRVRGPTLSFGAAVPWCLGPRPQTHSSVTLASSSSSVKMPADLGGKPDHEHLSCRAACEQVGNVRRIRQASVPWHFLYFLPLPQGHGSLRPTRGSVRRTGGPFSSTPSTKYHLPSSFLKVARSRWSIFIFCSL